VIYLGGVLVVLLVGSFVLLWISFAVLIVTVVVLSVKGMLRSRYNDKNH